MTAIEQTYWNRVFLASKEAGLDTEKAERMAFNAVATIRQMNKDMD